MSVRTEKQQVKTQQNDFRERETRMAAWRWCCYQDTTTWGPPPDAT